MSYVKRPPTIEKQKKDSFTILLSTSITKLFSITFRFPRRKHLILIIVLILYHLFIIHIVFYYQMLA